MDPREITTVISWLSRILREVRTSFDKHTKIKNKTIVQIIMFGYNTRHNKLTGIREEAVDAKV